MQRFRVLYVRTSYMEVEIAAENGSKAEEGFETLAAIAPMACDCGEPVGRPLYRIIDVNALESRVSARSDAPPVVATAPSEVPIMAPRLFHKMIARHAARPLNRANRTSREAAPISAMCHLRT